MSIHLYIISDSVGRTGRIVVDSVISQYPDISFDISVHNFVKDEKDLDVILDDARENQGIIIHTLAEKTLNDHLHLYCSRNEVEQFDLLYPLMTTIQEKTGIQPLRKVGAPRLMDESYFDRVNAIEFAVTYDDGQNPSGLLLADIVLLGASRTSKTPLSIYLANMSYKVANWPLFPEIDIPKELKEVDPKRMIGLTNDPEILKQVRRERMLSYGMDPDSSYASEERIIEELDYAQSIYDQLGCYVINVANKSIEETASLILDHLKDD